MYAYGPGIACNCLHQNTDSFPAAEQLLIHAFEQRLLTVPPSPFKVMCILLEKHSPRCSLVNSDLWGM